MIAAFCCGDEANQAYGSWVADALGIALSEVPETFATLKRGPWTFIS